MTDTNYDSIIIYTDGGSRGNPGKAASAFVIVDDVGEIIKEDSEYIGTNTNNVAEYTAMILALSSAKKLGVKIVTCYSDSELMIKQINGEYKVKKEHLKKLYDNIKVLCESFSKITFINVRRTNNMVQRADFLVNQCLDDH